MKTEEQNANIDKTMIPSVYVAIFKEEGEESYQLRSDECKKYEHCGDGDWFFDVRTKNFKRYWSYHDETNGNQYMHDLIKGFLLNN